VERAPAHTSKKIGNLLLKDQWRPPTFHLVEPGNDSVERAPAHFLLALQKSRSSAFLSVSAYFRFSEITASQAAIKNMCCALINPVKKLGGREKDHG